MAENRERSFISRETAASYFLVIVGAVGIGISITHVVFPEASVLKMLGDVSYVTLWLIGLLCEAIAIERLTELRTLRSTLHDQSEELRTLRQTLDKQSNALDARVQEVIRLLHYYEVINAELAEIQQLLRNAILPSHDPDHLFADWYDQRIKILRIDLQQSVHYRKYLFDFSVIQEQDRLDSVFHGTEKDYLLGTSTCDRIQWYVDTEGDRFLKSIDRRVSGNETRAVRYVRRIFIYKDLSDLSDHLVDLCLTLHKVNEHYEFKVISEREYEVLRDDFARDELEGDFGVYGNHYVWETSPDNPHRIYRGYVCTDQSRIARYEIFFNLVWEQAREHQPGGCEKYQGRRMSQLKELWGQWKQEHEELWDQWKKKHADAETRPGQQ